MLSFVLAGLMSVAGGGGEAVQPLPEQTLLLISEQGRMFMADPGPGWAPEGEEDTEHRYSFYYQASVSQPSISMLLVEADCKTQGRWRIRAGTRLTPTIEGETGQTGQHIVRRDSHWIQEPDQPLESENLLDHLGMAVWKNTCLGDFSFGAIGDLSPWAASILWKIQQSQNSDPELSIPTHPQE